MGWPSPTDYNGVIQNPRSAFRDARLKDCAVELKPGRPWPWPRSGANAIVYRLYSGSWSTAVRVFMNPPKAERQSRYEKVHNYLQRARPKCTVEFTYEAEGICVNGQWLPILTMEWVEGQTLGVWFREAVERQDSGAIKQMSHSWIKLVSELRALEMAHGDLQHGNVMVKDNQLLLVDYDGMFVPTMNTGDDQDRVAWENGLPAYQHPSRHTQLLSPAIDDFSAWIILISLRAVADDPSLWQRMIGDNEEETLLFTARDIKDPDQSRLWPELINKARDRKVREWSAALRASLDGPFDQIPPFDLDIFDPLREVIKAGHWREIYDLATSSKYASETFPSDLATTVQEASKRIECAERFEQKLRTGRIREIAATYRPELLDDWYEASAVAKGKAARAAAVLLDDLGRAESADPSGRPLVALWAQRGGELKGFPEGDAIRAKVEAWRKRIAAAERLEDAIRKGGPERAIVAAWQAVTAAGGHPESDVHRDRAETAQNRTHALESLAATPPGEDEAADRAFLKVWAVQSSQLADCSEAAPFGVRARAAGERARRLEELVRRIEEADQGRGSERTVVEAAEALPAGYGGGLADRVRQARERIAASAALEQALASSPQSDVAIASAADRARADGTWPTRPDVVARCELAIRRRDLLRGLDAIPTGLGLDEVDAQWAALWRPELMAGCHDAREHQVRHAKAVERIATFAALEQAIERNDAVSVRRLAQSPILADHPGLLRRKAEADALIAKSEKVERLLAAVRAGRAEEFLAEAEPALLAGHDALFQPFRALIEAWVEARLRRGDLLVPTRPPFIPGPSGSTVIARWIWKPCPLVRTCLVASDPIRFLDRPESAPQGTQILTPDTHRLSGGAALALPRGGRKLFVTVWPVVDLGWRRLIGPSLQVGPYLAAVAAATNDRRPSDARTADGAIRKLLDRFLNS